MRIRVPGGFRRRFQPLLERAREAGWDVYVVGGCVRDWMLGRSTKDFDFVTTGEPAPLARWCARRWGGELEAFGQFATMRLRAPGGLRFDFARARTETYPEPAALPVVRPGTLLEDLFRRDFTINAMAARPSEQGWADLVDPHGGGVDLKRGALRALHPRSFEDDPTRLFRAARFSARFGFTLERETERLRAAAVAGGFVDLLSRERLRGELARILEEGDSVPALGCLKAWGLARFLHPRLAWPRRLDGGTAMERLGAMALAMGGDGPDFIRSLHLERPASQALLEACRLWAARSASRTPLPVLAAEVLRRFAADGSGGRRRSLPPAALDPLLIGGADLKAMGRAAGPGFRELLGRAARAQWRGEFATREQALRWLKNSM